MKSLPLALEPTVAAVSSRCWSEIGVRGDRTCVELTRHTHCRNCPVYAAAAVQLLDRTLPDEHREESTRHYATVRPDTTHMTVSAIVFRLGVEWLALPTLSVREIADPRAVHALPPRRAGAHVGLVNVRGDLVIHVSLAELLGIDPRVSDSASAGRPSVPRLVVVGAVPRHLAFDVNEVAGVRRYDPAELRPVPSTLARANGMYTVGMLAVDDRTVGCLDSERTVHALAARVS